MSSTSSCPRAPLAWWQRVVGAALALAALTAAASGERFDHRHQALTDVLSGHVHWLASGHASGVDYAGLKRDPAGLQAYLRTLSSVTRPEFERWSMPQRRAFLINAYNAFTLELVLTEYPDLESIRDLGGLLSSPWKLRFFSLLGKRRSLDEVEHDLIRGAADFDDPRIHFAVNCASIGCPALRPEAYLAEALDEQLEDQTRRFLGDRGRNRAEPRAARLVVSPIFDWYGEDFSRGLRGARSVAGFLAAHAEPLGMSPAEQAALLGGKWSIAYGDYDWSLNRLR